MQNNSKDDQTLKTQQIILSIKLDPVNNSNFPNNKKSRLTQINITKNFQ